MPFTLPKLQLMYLKNIQILLTIVQAKGASLPLSLPPLNAHRYFSWISRGLNAENILDAGR